MNYLTNLYNRLFARPNEPVIKCPQIEPYITGKQLIDIINLLNNGFCVVYSNNSMLTILPVYLSFHCEKCKRFNKHIYFILDDNGYNERLQLCKKLISKYRFAMEPSPTIDCGVPWAKKPFATVDYTKVDLSKLNLCRINRTTKNIIRHYYSMIVPPKVIYTLNRNSL